jgi:transcriptional regulator with XRE-family HTH domain
MAIREHRLRIGVSQEELGYMTHMHRTYVGGLERGERNPTVAKLFALADAFDVETSALFVRAEALRRRDGD